MSYVISGPPSLYKRNKIQILTQFDTQKNARKWIRKQLKTDEAYYMDIILEFGLHFKKNDSRRMGPCLKNNSFNFPSRKEMMDYLVIPECNISRFIDTHRELIF